MAKTAAELSFDGVDLTVRPGGHVLPERIAQDLPRAVKAVRDSGLEAPMLSTTVSSADEEPTDEFENRRRTGYSKLHIGVDFLTIRESAFQQTLICSKKD